MFKISSILLSSLIATPNLLAIKNVNNQNNNNILVQEANMESQVRSSGGNPIGTPATDREILRFSNKVTNYQ
ncbi:hypothetical protein SSABA_v1c03830 [Spiroplasma sabaudiense Ar-1343]|uniref:Uncharacterized protein n=1 Tax=Spiroplasma sabaudiense Ar-1343 TaxID=1276257 RepID=W6A9T7_9MOLU|nr:hypothetical protein [Spiroplasma sabaudiense]AHI53792.1 hypothetical protein SSABA_v1c03830 [Spiroplasma sabaudiense Ar-1343]